MKKIIPILFAILAAVFYAFSTPISKLLLNEIPSTLLAGLLYLGAGIGMSAVYFISKAIKKEDRYESLSKEDIPYTILMIVLDILAPIFLLLGLSISNPESIALINNFEIVATSIIALVIFKEKISFNLWIGIIIITASVIILSIGDLSNIQFSIGALYAMLACLCWGLENNCTRKISNKNPFQIVILKGLFSGLGSLIIGLVLKERATNVSYIIYAILLGFIAYGLSVFLYVKAQKYLGASKTSAYYAIAPFISVALSFLIFKEQIHYTYAIALGLMIIGSIIVTLDGFKEEKDSIKLD